MLIEGNQMNNFMSSSGSGTVINYGSGSDFLTSYGSGYGSGSPVPVPQHWSPPCLIIFYVMFKYIRWWYDPKKFIPKPLRDSKLP